MRHSIRAIHFIGVGGAGMSGLAEVMAGLGFQVTGSDAREQPSVARLRRRGVQVFIGHDAAHVAAADCVVYSGAIAADNVERQAAAHRGIPIVPRAQMLGELMRFKPGIAVAGTHGKTTVSSMIAHILTSAGLSPTSVIGGRLLSVAEEDTLIGSGEYVVVEADESDASFLHLQPVIAVVTNIDDDHIEAFADDFNQLNEAFVSFLANLPFYGSAVICIDDPAAAALAKQIESRRVVTYGMGEAADVRASQPAVQQSGMAFTLSVRGSCGKQDGDYPLQLRALGEHNVQNALAAAAVALEIEVPVAAIQQALASFGGVGRRLEFYGEVSAAGCKFLLVDDYAHHPSEIRATVAALRSTYPGRRLLLLFQPHRYSRTQRLSGALARALSTADAVLVMPVYAAGESAPASVAEELAAALLDKVGAEKSLCPPPANIAAVAERLQRQVKKGDIVVCMGAGDIATVPAQLKEWFDVNRAAV